MFLICVLFRLKWRAFSWNVLRFERFFNLSINSDIPSKEWRRSKLIATKYFPTFCLHSLMNDEIFVRAQQISENQKALRDYFVCETTTTTKNWMNWCVEIGWDIVWISKCWLFHGTRFFFFRFHIEWVQSHLVFVLCPKDQLIMAFPFCANA